MRMWCPPSRGPAIIVRMPPRKKPVPLREFTLAEMAMTVFVAGPAAGALWFLALWLLHCV